MYQKSPYRKKEKKQRIFDILPDSFFKVIGFGFPEDENMGEDSSEDEEDMMKRQMANMELKVDKIKSKPEPQISSPLVQQKKAAHPNRAAYNYEPSSA